MSSLLYRNIVPNVPRLAAGNGQLVFRGRSLSHRAEMRLSITFGGSISFTGGSWRGPGSIDLVENSWTGVGVDLENQTTQLPWDYGWADIVTADGVRNARRKLNGGVTHHTRREDNWRMMGIFFNGTYYDNDDMEVGCFNAALRGSGTDDFCLDHAWDNGLATAPWYVRAYYGRSYRITPYFYDKNLWPGGVSGIAPVRLWSHEEVYDPDEDRYFWWYVLAGAVFVPDNNPVLRWDCVDPDPWPQDDFRLGTRHRFVYAGPSGVGIDISNVYIDITATYA